MYSIFSMSRLFEYLMKFSVFKLIFKYLESRYTYFSNRNLLNKNKRFENIYNGKRCFIVANGPSLRNQDLSHIKDEYTFGVNNLMITQKYEEFEPKFYVVVDSKFFDDDFKVLSDNLKSLTKKKHKPICIFPLSKRKYIEKYQLDKSLEIIWIAYDIRKDKKIRKNIRLSKMLPFSFNVANVALFAALAMGFSEIYLLGVDMTGVLHTYDENWKFSDTGHFFSSNEKLSKYETEKFKFAKNEQMLKLYAGTFYAFRQAFNYANKNGIKIINLTESGALDIFPLDRYNDVLKK